MLNSITFITLLSSTILALPHNDLLTTRQTTSPVSTFSFLPTTTRCPIDTGNLLLPTNQTTLILPTSPVLPVFMTIGRGIQVSLNFIEV